MIKVKITHEGDKRTIEIEGHAKSAPLGYDIICASVSTIWNLLVLGLHALAEENPGYITIED